MLPENANDVSLTIKTITFWKVHFSIRSAGHSPNPTFSSITSPGILIDLKYLNTLTLSPDESLVSIGPGLKWGEVYAALDPHGISIVGGRIPQVGVGGLILGGGLSHFSGKYGLAADNVVDFEIVLGEGRVVDANERENEDLFWGLKGGGANFGT